MDCEVGDGMRSRRVPPAVPPVAAPVPAHVTAPKQARISKSHIGTVSLSSQLASGSMKSTDIASGAMPISLGSKHCMLSYQVPVILVTVQMIYCSDDLNLPTAFQWDVQDRVIRMRNQLVAKGVRTWMDVDAENGMGVDMYESMAEGVSNAAVVVVCLTAAYSESEVRKRARALVRETDNANTS